MEESLMQIIIINTLVFSRLAAFFLQAPFFNSMAIPQTIKAGFALIITFLLYPLLSVQQNIISIELPNLVLLIVSEFLIGLLMAFSLSLTFTAIILAGEFVDRRIGFFLADVFDPQSGEQSPLVGQLKVFFATLLFLFINGHHLLLRLFRDSYNILPLGAPFALLGSGETLLRIAGDLFFKGFIIALPVVGSLFVVDVVFGFLARTIPQINIFVVGLPTKILIGLLIIYLTLPSLAVYFEGFFQSMFDEFYRFLLEMGG